MPLVSIDAHYSVLIKRLREEDDFSAPKSPRRVARKIVDEACLKKHDEWAILSSPDPDDEGRVDEYEGSGRKAAVDKMEELARDQQEAEEDDDEDEEEEDDD